MIKVETRQIHLGQALALLAVSQDLVVLDESIANVNPVTSEHCKLAASGH